MFRALSQKFLKDRRGYVAVIFGILALPILAIAGGAVDYQQVGSQYAGLRKAAEVAAIAVARNRFKPARTTFTDPTENDTTLMTNVFNANFANDTNKFTYVTPTLTSVDLTEKTVVVTATAGVKTVLLRLIGFDTIDISVVAKAAAVFSDKNIEVHFMLDMSPSMGAPGDGAAPPLNAYGCFFMCHDDGSTIRAAGKTPKLDTVFDRFGATNGMAYLIQDAADTNPIPITVNFTGHYFDRQLHAEAYFAHGTDANVKTRFIDTTPRYMLGADGVYGGTDLKTSLTELHNYFPGKGWSTTNSRRIIILVSDGMHSRALQPFDPAVCTTLKGDGDVYTLYINNPESVYDNPSVTYVAPDGTLARNTWDWAVLRNGGSNDYGYYSGLNNAALLMKNCASDPAWAYEGETTSEITNAIDQMTENIIAPNIRVLN